MSKKDQEKEELKDTLEQESKDEKPTKEKKSKKSSKASNKLKDENKVLSEELNELKDKYLRQVAEFDNFRKRNAKERIDLIKTASQETIRALLPIIDDFDRAVKAAEADDNVEPLSEGVILIYNRLKNVMKQQGLEEMETIGADFDPEFHEALTKIPAPSEDMKGKIVDTIEKGYTLKGKIIRHARVVVGE